MAPPSPGSTGGSTRFFGSQVGGQSVINYSYTDMPWKLLAYDIIYFFRFAWAIPYVLLPANKPGSGDLDELSPTRKNIFCIAVHLVLCVLQLAFIVLILPLTILLPVWTAVLGAGLFLALNKLVCDTLLNGRADTYTSDPEYAPALERHAHEQWIFLNGVAVGQHWLKNNLNRLALTFKRPILGIHNKTDGIIFDIVECLIQRNFGYATKDVRLAYSLVKEKLYDPKYSKVVFILHSQGGIEGGLVLDWLLQELPQDLLAKLEVYTFGNASNHFNNPHRHMDSQKAAEANPGSAAIDVIHRHYQQRHQPPPPNGDPSSSSSSSSSSSTAAATAPFSRRRQPHQSGSGGPASLLMRETSSSHPASVSDRAIGHVEHYAHTTDFVALWGVLHFATSATAQPSMPRFMGRVFARADRRGGHQFCHHYLDGMFPLTQVYLEENGEEEDEEGEGEGRVVEVADDGEGGANTPAVGGGNGKGIIGNRVIGGLVRRPKRRFAGKCLEAGAGEGKNAFMESEVAVGRAGDEAADVHAAFEGSWLGVLAGDGNAEEESRIGEGEKGEKGVTTVTTTGGGSGGGSSNVTTVVHSNSPVLSRKGSSQRVVKVKDLSRLWQYRDGRSPEETPAGLGRDADGVVRGMTL